jgi:glycosyltransferase involved in cell wall biosynthesis
MPTVSIVVPNYNHAKYLRQRIESVLGQTYQDFELILLDDCSTDESRDVLRGYAKDARVRIEFNAENSGTPFKQWNKGVRMARGKYVWIAESDDWADTRLLELLTRILEEQPEVAFAYCRSHRMLADGSVEGYFDTYLDCLDGSRWKRDFVIDGIEQCRDYLLLCNTVPNASAVVFRKSIFEEAGGADERLRICGDYKLWMGMALRGKIAYVAEPLNYFRHHEQNVHRNSRGLQPYVEHFHTVQWLVERLVQYNGAQSPQTTWDELPSVTNTREQIRECRDAADHLEGAVLSLNPSRPGDVARAFRFYRLSLDDVEFAAFPPGRWRFFRSQWTRYWNRFPTATWKRRVLDLVHLIEALITGFPYRNWLGKKYALIKQPLEIKFSKTRR